MGEILAFEINLRPAKLRAQPFGVRERGGPPNIGRKQSLVFGLKSGVVAKLLPRFHQVVEGGHERFWHKAAAIGAVFSARIRPLVAQ